MEKVRTSILEKEKINNLNKLKERSKISPFKEIPLPSPFKAEDTKALYGILNSRNWNSKYRKLRYNFHIPANKLKEFKDYLWNLSLPAFLVNVDFGSVQCKLSIKDQKWFNLYKTYELPEVGDEVRAAVYVRVEGSRFDREHWHTNMKMVTNYLNDKYEINYTTKEE